MNEKRALAESEAGEGPATKKSRAHSNNHPLLMVPLDIFSEQLLVFCERKEVATIMAIPLIRDHFRLDKTSCPIHGTRLNKKDDSSALECIDCVMEERNWYRCDQCDTFRDGDKLHNGTCGKVICDECKYSARCSDCGKYFHFDCTTCGMVTFCNSCDMVFCGTCQQLKTCDGCSTTECRVCREWFWMGCNTCNKEYCEPCNTLRGMLDFCDYCGSLYRQDCGCVETCRYYEDSICKSSEASSTYARFAETTPVRITIFVLLPVRNAKSVSAVTVTRDHTLTNPRMLCALPVTRKQSRRSAFTHSTMMRTTMMM